MIAAAWKSTDTALTVTVIALLSLSGFFALAETALVRMSRSKAAALHDERLRGAAALERLASRPVLVEQMQQQLAQRLAELNWDALVDRHWQILQRIASRH